MSLDLSRVWGVELMPVLPADHQYEPDVSYQSKIYELDDEMVGCRVHVIYMFKDVCEDDEFRDGKWIAIVKCCCESGGTMNYPLNFTELSALLEE